MRIHDFPPAPNPTKLRVYLGEKGIDIPRVNVSLVDGEQRSPEFLAKNPMGGVPVLELDDGTFLTESLAIIEYLEELHPDPPMIGMNPLERARVRSVERTIDIGILGRTARIVHNRKSPLPGVTGIPEVAEQEFAKLPAVLDYVDRTIGRCPFVCGERPTIADCTLFGGLAFGMLFGLEIDPRFANVARWFEAFKERPSART